jgi:hypothetical protein
MRLPVEGRRLGVAAIRRWRSTSRGCRASMRFIGRRSMLVGRPRVRHATGVRNRRGLAPFGMRLAAVQVRFEQQHPAVAEQGAVAPGLLGGVHADGRPGPPALPSCAAGQRAARPARSTR